MQNEQKSENITELEKTGGIQGKPERDERGRLLPGNTANPNGRPLQALNFSTKWKAFIEKVAEANKITPEDLDNQILNIALKKIKEGNFNFYKDTQDRVFGTAQQNIKHEGQLTISTVLDELENGQETSGQNVEDKPSLPNQEQSGQINSVQIQPGTEPLPPE